MLTMSYFHPWTLVEGFEDERVPYAVDLRPRDATWEGALSAWLSGRVLSTELVHYINNGMSVSCEPS